MRLRPFVAARRPDPKNSASSVHDLHSFLVSVLSLVIFSILTSEAVEAQFLGVRSLGLRVPGMCPPGCFDCGFGRRCVPIRNFHDGRPDCPDGSDEWCFPGFFRCGAYCVELKYLAACMLNARCDGRRNQPGFCDQTKEKLCREENPFPCKSYGECVLWSWVNDGQRQCMDGSDEDEEYVAILQRGWKAYLEKQQFGNEPGSLSNQNRSAGYRPQQPGAAQPGGYDGTANNGNNPAAENQQWIEKGNGTGSNSPQGSTHSESGENGYHEGPPPVPNELVPFRTTPQYPFNPPRTTWSSDNSNRQSSSSGSKTPSNSFPSTVYQSGQKPTNEYKITVNPGQNSNKTVHIVVNPWRTVNNQNSGIPEAEGFGDDDGKQPIVPNIQTEGSPSGREGQGSVVVPPTRPPLNVQPEVYHTHRPVYPPSVVPPGFWYPLTTEKPNEPDKTQNGQGTTSGFETGINSNSEAWPRGTTRIFSGVGSTSARPPNGVVHPTLLPFDYTVPTAETPPPYETVFVPQIVPVSYPESESKPSGGDAVIRPIGPWRPNRPVPAFTSTSRRPWAWTSGTIDGAPRTDTTTPKTNTAITKPTVEEITLKPEQGGTSSIDNPRRNTTTQNGKEATTTASASTVPPAATTSTAVSAEILECEKRVNAAINRSIKSASSLTRCDCPSGQMRRDFHGECQDATTSSFVIHNVTPPCGAKDFTRYSNEQFESLLLRKVKNALNVPICIVDSNDGRALVTAVCDGGICNMEEMTRKIERTADQGWSGDEGREEGGMTRASMKLEGLAASICTDHRLNNCHRYAECHPDGLSYKCICKDGTNDTSIGRPGTDCLGIPDDDNCVLVFGVCLIFWTILFLGLLFLLPILFLCCLTIWRRWKAKKRKISPNVAFNTTPTVIKLDNFEKTPTGKLLQQAFRARSQGVLASGRALQKMELKGILKTTESQPPPLTSSDLEHDLFHDDTDAAVFASDERTSASEPPSARSRPPVDELSRTRPSSIRESESSPRLAELARSPVTSTTGTPSHGSRIGSAQAAAAVAAGAAAAAVARSQAQTAPASPVFSIKVPVGSKTAPPTPQIKDEHPPFAHPLAVSYSASELMRHDMYSPAPSLASKSSRHVPTIWETYRVLGDQYAKPETARRDSSDSLEKLVKARYPTPPEEAQRVAQTSEKASLTPIVPVAKQAPLLARPEDIQKIETEKPPNPLTRPLQQSSECVSEKLAEMLGVTSSGQDLAGEEAKTPENSVEATELDATVNPPIERVLEPDQAALLELALMGVQLQALPEAAPEGEPAAEQATDRRAVQTAEAAEAPRDMTSLDELSSTRSDLSPSGRVKTGPTFTRKRWELLKKERSKLPMKKEVFVPRGISETQKPSSVRRSRVPRPIRSSGVARNGDGGRSADRLYPPPPDADGSTSDESDLEIAIQRFEDAVRKKGVDIRRGDHELDVPGRRRRRRHPERQLSSISEKSAEIAEEVLMGSTDYTMSAPSTTRAPRKETFVTEKSSLHAPPVSHDETSDPDIPKETQQVTRRPKAQNGKQKQQSDDPPLTSRSSGSIKRKPPLPITKSSSQIELQRQKRRRIKPILMPEFAKSEIRTSSEFFPVSLEKAKDDANKTAGSLTSRIEKTTTHRQYQTRENGDTSRHPTLSRKIRHRGHGGRYSARDGHHIPTTSCGDLCQWCGHGSDSSAYFMPGIRSRKDPGFYSARAASISPTRLSFARSLSSLRGSHTDLSPYFDPSKDSSKPHKEGLWWGHPHA